MIGHRRRRLARMEAELRPRSLLHLPLLYPLIAFVLARRVVVRGWSMYPTLAPGERVLFDRLAYRLDWPTRGDIVLARHPAQPALKLVKRVVAIPGERVTVHGDEWQAEEPSEQDPSYSRETDTTAAHAWTLGRDEYFLVGDAPDLSTDGRHFGATNRRDIQGRAWLVYWPPDRLRWVRVTDAG